MLKLILAALLETYPAHIILSEAFLRDHPGLDNRHAQLIIRIYQDLEKIMAPEEILELFRPVSFISEELLIELKQKFVGMILSVRVQVGILLSL